MVPWLAVDALISGLKVPVYSVSDLSINILSSHQKFMQKPKLHTDENCESLTTLGITVCPYHTFGFID